MMRSSTSMSTRTNVPDTQTKLFVVYSWKMFLTSSSSDRDFEYQILQEATGFRTVQDSHGTQQWKW
jgi:hypothetical protein